jgi:predicted ArsR family transcriptional regulator
MLLAARIAFGEEGLGRLLEEWEQATAEQYRRRMPGPEAPLAERAGALARIRLQEGYMAECRRTREGAFELVENHCSIASAARACPMLCEREISLFRTLLGPEVSVERVEHLLAGDRRCAYRISPRDRA